MNHSSQREITEASGHWEMRDGTQKPLDKRGEQGRHILDSASISLIQFGVGWFRRDWEYEVVVL